MLATGDVNCGLVSGSAVVVEACPEVRPRSAEPAADVDRIGGDAIVDDAPG